ncbi:unnamed protein product [Larinioides sclopetarius]|uniref:Uncharacterized protein n=1 Tax=Larinioides sclopetarius TaxID=280406 RepID=A0AAV1ZUU7_9ARAC
MNIFHMLNFCVKLIINSLHITRNMCDQGYNIFFSYFNFLCLVFCRFFRELLLLFYVLSSYWDQLLSKWYCKSCNKY